MLHWTEQYVWQRKFAVKFPPQLRQAAGRGPKCLYVIAASLALSSCVTSGCPSLTSYSREFQTRAAAELDRLPTGSPTKQLVSDYGKLRDACRVQ